MLAQCEKKSLRDSPSKNSSTTRESSLKCAASPRWLRNVHFLLILMVNESYFYKFFTSHCSLVKGMEKLGVDKKQKIFRNFMQLSIVRFVEKGCLSSWVQGCQGALEFFLITTELFYLLQRRRLRFLWQDCELFMFIACIFRELLGSLSRQRGTEKRF